MPKPNPPEAFLPDVYDGALLESFCLSCGVTALIMILQNLEEDESKRIKELIIARWKATWIERFRLDVSVYNDILSDSPTTKTEDEPQPEEYQLGFNRALAEAEIQARTVLGLTNPSQT